MAKSKSKKPVKAVKKDSLLNYFVDWSINKATEGNLDKQTSNFQISFNKILSETHKKEIFQILEYPTFVYVGHLDRLRDALLSIVPDSMRNDIDLQILEYTTPNLMSVTDKKMTRMRSRIEQAYTSQKNAIIEMKELLKANDAPPGVTEDSIIAAEEKLKRRKRKKFSFKQVRDHKLTGGAYVNTYVFLELACKTTEQLNTASSILRDLLHKGIKEEPYEFDQVSADLYEHIKRFGIASLMQPVKKKEDVIPCMSVPSNVCVVDEDFKPGIIRSKYPKVYVGHMLGNGYPYHFNFTGSTDASNLLLLADTGSGKTAQTMTMILWALMDKKMHVVINDYKGSEWTEFMKLVSNHAYVSFNTGNPSFVNTYRIPNYEKLGYSKPRAALQSSSHITTQILVSLINPTEAEHSITEAICADVVSMVYLAHGVDPQFPDTYHQAELIDFVGDTWDVVNTISAGGSPIGEKYSRDDLNRVKSSLARYFDARGSKRFLFENEVDIDKVLDAKLIVFDHGMQTTGGAITKTASEMRCGMLQKTYLTTIYCAMQKLNDEYSLEVQEEVAQLFADKYTCEHLCRDITGNRSMNKTNILLTNTIGPLLNPRANAEYLEPVKENINLFMIGRCTATVTEDFISYIGRPELNRSAMAVSQQVNSELDHAFMLYVKHGEMRGAVVLKSRLPDDIFTTIMKSRTVDKDGELAQ